MKTTTTEQRKRATLPVLIRYRAQDFETRYLDDPRALYVEEFQSQHPDDGFFAVIPTETAAGAFTKQDVPRPWLTLVELAMTLGSLGWIAYRILS